MNLCKPVCIAENKKANLVIVTGEYRRPLDAGDTWMREELFRQYENLFEDAVFLTEGDREVQFRVKTAALPIYYAGIVLGYGGPEERFRRIARFAEQARRTGLVMVEEWKITVDKFVTDAVAELGTCME